MLLHAFFGLVALSTVGGTTMGTMMNNLATQKGAHAAEIEVRLKPGVICTASLLDELTDLVSASIGRSNRDLVRCFCTGYTIKIQLLRTLQPMPGLRSSDEMALEILRQYKYPASPFRSNATYVDYSANVAVVDVYNCFDDPTVPFEADCGSPIVPRMHMTWLGLEPYAPLTYVIFVGVCVLLCLLFCVLVLCIYRSRTPAEPPKKVDVLTWRAADVPPTAPPTAIPLAAAPPTAAPSMRPLEVSPGPPREAKRPKRTKPAAVPVISPPTTLKKKQLSEQIFITHTPTTAASAQTRYKYPTVSQLTTFHFHPDSSTSKPLPDIEFVHASPSSPFTQLSPETNKLTPSTR